MKDVEELEMYSIEDYMEKVIKKMKRKDLEEDMLKFIIQWQKLIDFVCEKRIITPSGVKYIKSILSFGDED